MLSSVKWHTFKMARKARHIIIGERGEEPIWRTPGPKSVLEFHGWVLKAKLSSGFQAALGISIGAIAVLLAQSWEAPNFFWWVLAIGFIVGFLTGGDVETGPK